jgi:transcriptional regulator with GAF, ATPase, and Fis domain
MEHLEARSDFESLEHVRRHVVDALTLTHGNQRRAAVLLGVSRWTLARLVKRFELHDFVTTIRSEHQPVPVLHAGSLAGDR